MENMNHLFQAGVEIQQFFQKRDWPFCFIGGLAVLRWGEPRMTGDLDVCLLCGLGNEEKYVHIILNNFKSRVTGAEQFALDIRILLLLTSQGIPVDVSLSGLSFEEQMIGRATPFVYTPDCSLITAAAEDIVVLKSFANRDKDWGDVESIIMRQGLKLDKKYILKKLGPLCELKQAPEIITKLESLLNK